jgi:hypothetical protein
MVPDDRQRLRDLLQEGKCCSVALVQLGLELTGKTNEPLLQAVGGLCGGVRSGLLCGALSGAACMMNLLDPENANRILVPELAEWFVETIAGEYGGTNCADILQNDPGNQARRCPRLIEATYLQAREIMRKHENAR